MGRDYVSRFPLELALQCCSVLGKLQRKLVAQALNERKLFDLQ